MAQNPTVYGITVGRDATRNAGPTRFTPKVYGITIALSERAAGGLLLKGTSLGNDRPLRGLIHAA